MKLNQAPTFRVEDFPSEQSWIGRLFSQLNPFITAVSQTFDSNIDFLTNFQSVTKDYKIQSFQPFSLQWPYKNNPPVEVRVTKSFKGTQQTPTVLFAAWSFDANQSAINIADMVELSDRGATGLSGQYIFTLRAII